MKTFLFPKVLRRGQPVLFFVKKEKSLSKKGYLFWLGLYHELSPSPFTGDGSDYGSVSEVQISEKLYNAFLREAKYNQEKYKVSYKKPDSPEHWVGGRLLNHNAYVPPAL